jgi:hypothetical protein
MVRQTAGDGWHGQRVARVAPQQEVVVLNLRVFQFRGHQGALDSLSISLLVFELPGQILLGLRPTGNKLPLLSAFHTPGR